MQILMPTAFSPNNDGNNDVLGLYGSGIDELLEFKIFNKSGTVVFSSTNAEHVWDGKHNGNPVPAGIYFYVVRAKSVSTGEILEKKGEVKVVL